MKGVLVALAAALALVPGVAAAGEEVDLVRVDAPERTMAGKTFDVAVELLNKGPARRVYLFAALYEGAGGSACGAATDPRFRTYTPLYQAVVDLPANGRVAWPAPGDRWQHQYEAEHVEARETTDEFCVFVAESDRPPRLEWLDFESLAMRTRGQNAKPHADFAWEPARPRATQDARFEATASDAENDPLTYRWDFGHHNASGRARAEGPVAFHPFYPDGTFTVTLTVSDGFDETVVRRDVQVAPADAPPGDDDVPVVTQRDATPAPAILAPLGALAAAWLRRRRAPPSRSP